MSGNLFRLLFRNRQRWIRAADVVVAEADQVFRLAESGQKRRCIAAAAKSHEKAAALYLRAGLGLLAKQQFAAASRYYSLNGDHEHARLNQERWLAVSTYWEADTDA